MKLSGPTRTVPDFGESVSQQADGQTKKPGDHAPIKGEKVRYRIE
jgi:hypothetical protein